MDRRKNETIAPMHALSELNPRPEERRRVFLTVAAGVFMSTMDSSQVNVALPVLMRSFASSLALTEWVVQVYLLTVTVLLVFWGRLCGRWGCGPVYAHGLLVFTLGSALCAMASSIWLLIVFRFLQALGASMMMAAGPALIRSVFPAERLGRGLGLIGIATSLGLMTGPVLGGLLLRWVHWRAIFWVTVPVGLVFYFASRKNLMRPAREKIPMPNKVGIGSFDLAGALLWAGAVIITVLLATHATWLCSNRSTFFSALFAVGAIAALSAWLLFFWRESRAVHPILPMPLFRQRFFAMAVLSSTLSFSVLFVVMILIPFYLATILRLPPDRLGYVMMALPMTVFLVSPVAGRLHDRIGARIVATGGLLCGLAGLLFLGRLTAGTSPLYVAGCLALMGFGQAMFLAPNSASVLAEVPDELAGISAGLLATARNFGMLAGTALAGLGFTLHFASATGGLDLRDFIPGLEPAFMAALRATLHYTVVVAMAGVVVSGLRGGRRRASGRER
jgi:EmrB/QacA subfamily drug resistance transporter